MSFSTEDRHYDLEAAIEYNNITIPFKFEIVCELLSEHHDEGEYFWLLRNLEKPNEFVVLTGSHDYTGWDCQSGASISGIFGIEHLALQVPEYDIQMRPVRNLMIQAAERFIHSQNFDKQMEKIKNEDDK
jgi:hypothetical protein